MEFFGSPELRQVLKQMSGANAWNLDRRKLILPLTPETQEGVARHVLSSARRNHYVLNWFPWGEAKITPTTFAEYFRLACQEDGQPVGEFYATWGAEAANHLRRQWPNLPPELRRTLAQHGLARAQSNFGDQAPQLRMWVILNSLLSDTGLYGEPWQMALLADPRTFELARHAFDYRGATPNAKWLKRAEALTANADPEAYRTGIVTGLDAMSRAPLPLNAELGDSVKGMLTLLGFFPGRESAALAGRALRVCGEKLPGVGPRTQKGFTGAIWALERLGTFDALAEMTLAKSRLRSPKLIGELEGRLQEAAAAQNITIEELEERVLPDYGLNADGRLRLEMGDGYAEVHVDDRARVQITFGVGTRILAGPSKAMKEGFAEEIALLKQRKKEIEFAVSAQRRRLDSLFLSPRRIPFLDWQERYLRHPIVGPLARRLIWEFQTDGIRRLALPFGGEMQDANGQPVEVDPHSATVRLWHPIESDPAEAVAWQNAIFQYEITQPFKQAYREVYVLTAAEERTGLYSNRFAAQIIRQHQARALMQERGWRADLHGFYDHEPTLPNRTVEAFNLRAEFLVDIAGNEMSEAGIALYLATDQVRFFVNGNRTPLAEIPPLVFSEIMRDVDLFVGVASVGNDPEWMDHGVRETYTRQFWHDSSFGELSLLAETRKMVLERLLPRLKIGSVSEIEGRFLRVRGKRHTYKIHLGSGNILIAPQDRYLCIVPAGKNELANVYLPFEGDRTLSIILSKPTMLMNDDKITDPSILSQL